MRFSDASRTLSNEFSNPDWASNPILLILAVCIITGVVMTLILVERYYRNRNTKNGYYNPNRLFRELCQAHEFTNEQQTILRNIARELQLKNPAVLFIEPKHLELALTESVVRFPQEVIEKIYNEVFCNEVIASGSTKEEDNTWFAWTKIVDNPEADQLKKEPKKESNKQDAIDSLTDLSQTQQWDPWLWQGVRQAVNHDTGLTPEIVPVLQAPDQTVKEKPVYKPRYPETQDVLVHQSPGEQVSSNTGNQKKTLPKASLPQTPPSPGAQILSSMLYSVSDVTNELVYSSIRNHLTRSLSLSPQALGEMKQRIPEVTSSVPSSSTVLDEIMVSPQKPFRQVGTPTQVETKTEPKVAIKQIDLVSIGLKLPKPFLNGG